MRGRDVIAEVSYLVVSRSLTAPRGHGQQTVPQPGGDSPTTKRALEGGFASRMLIHW
jgi:hypothetical protein